MREQTDMPRWRPHEFEPEGSDECTTSPMFMESPDTPAYLKWAKDINILLDDKDGVMLFKKFMDQEWSANSSILLDFWFACNGVKISTDKGKIKQLVKIIYQKYIKNDKIKLDPDIKSRIVEKVCKIDEAVDQTFYNEAQAEVENILRSDTYPLFLKSDMYIECVQNDGASPKDVVQVDNDTNTSQSVPLLRPNLSSQFLSGALPTLLEDHELTFSDYQSGPDQLQSVLPSNSFSAMDPARQKKAKMEGSFPSQQGRGRIPPPHVSYTVTSERESENTSDAYTTDDAMSLTDSSVDGRDGRYPKRPLGKLRHYHLDKNKNAGLSESVIPRTSHPPKDKDLAEKEVSKFAALLTKKLEKVLVEEQKRLADQQKLEMVKNLKIEEQVDDLDLSQSCRRQAPNTSVSSLLQDSKSSEEFSQLVRSLLQPKDNDDGDILDHHVKLTFPSNGQTPSRTPPANRHSPELFHHGVSMVSSYPSFIGGPAAPVIQAMVPIRTVMQRGLIPAVSYDSGISAEKFDPTSFIPPSEEQGGKRHYRKSTGVVQQGVQGTPQKFSSAVLYDDRPQARRKGGNPHGTETVVTGGDSGVYEGTVERFPNLHDLSNEKVMAWMLDNEKFTTSNTQCSTDESERSSSQKRSHKSGGSSKKTLVEPATNRSLDISTSSLPKHPIASDPGMPIMPQPNPMVQLEETKRRLLEEAGNKGNRSLMSSAAVLSPSTRDRLAMPPPSLPPRSHAANRSFGSHGPPPPVPITQSATSLDASKFERCGPGMSSYPSSSSGASGLNSSQTSSSVDIVVGYYLGGEQIPYRTMVKGPEPTLGQFKAKISKKGHYRYFFKKPSDEFDTGVVYEEIYDDSAPLPLFDGKVMGKLERMD